MNDSAALCGNTDDRVILDNMDDHSYVIAT